MKLDPIILVCGRHTEKPNGQQEKSPSRGPENIRKVRRGMRDVGTSLMRHVR